MRVLNMARLRLRSLLFRNRVEAELEEELRYHFEREVDAHLALGLTQDEAITAARRSMAGLALQRDECRDARGTAWVDHLTRDVRSALRQFTKHKTLSAVITTTLALSVGATTAIYSVAKAVIFAPLPFPKPDCLTLIFEGEAGERYQPGGENFLSSVRPATYQDWREQARSFERMAATQRTQAVLLTSDRAVVIDGWLVDDDFFETLGVPARLGRVFTSSDYATSTSNAVVLGDRLWRELYNADPSLVGRDIVVNGVSHRVVGVMPPEFLPTRQERDPQLWLPLHWTPETRRSQVLWGNVIYARLKAGVTVAQAQAEMDVVARRMRAANPEAPPSAVVAPLDGYLFGHHERMFFLLLVAAGLLLLITCANVANLLLGRVLERSREFAVRCALGASRAAMLRQVLVENLLIATIGGLCGAALSQLLTKPALALLPASARIPRLDQVHLDVGVLSLALCISLLAGLLFGVAPAVHSARGDPWSALKAGGRGYSGGRDEARTSDLLVMTEVALSLSLLVGGGLLTRAFLTLLHSDPGFRAAGAVVLQLAVPSTRYGTFETGGANLPRQQLYTRIEQAVRSVPGVEAVGVSDKIPLRQSWNPWDIGVEGRAPGVRDGLPRMSKRWGIPIHGAVAIQTVSPGFFPALGIALVRGRLFDVGDRPGVPITGMINEAAARTLFPNEDPIGKRVVVDMTSYVVRMTIVGIVADARLDGMDRGVLPELFQPMAQLPSGNAWLSVRARSDAASIAGAVRQVVREIDPEIGIVELRAMTDVVGDSLWRERFTALLVETFAGLALVIAGAGLYAVIGRAVERRLRELSIRVALGASSTRIALTVLGHGLAVTALGLTVGTPLTVTAARLAAPQSGAATDLAWMLALVSGGLIVVTVLACWLPLKRALTVDPILMLRSE